MNKELFTFTRDQIRSRRGRKNVVYYYVPVEYVINRLNQVSDNVQIIIKDKIITEKETIVLV